MNKNQKQVQRQLLKNEKEILKILEESYQEALNDIMAKISELLARTDTQNLQSIIYQLNYQKALKTQISAILDNLQANNYNSISEYLVKCYEDAFIGTLYDLQAQGVPLLFPIDQDQVIKSITLNTKLKKPLYDSLGIDVKELKRIIRAEVSRGISQNFSYEVIARNLKLASGNSYNNSVRIARTEGHRISSEATYEAQTKAKSKGAQIMKQWDSTLDSKTRTTHQYLDGQMVEVDKPFKNANGDEAMYPGGFDIASEDINCRCVLLQRAKWALTDEEFTKMNGNTNNLVHFKDLKDYENFKSEFWKWSDR